MNGETQEISGLHQEVAHHLFRLKTLERRCAVTARKSIFLTAAKWRLSQDSFKGSVVNLWRNKDIEMETLSFWWRSSVESFQRTRVQSNAK